MNTNFYNYFLPDSSITSITIADGQVIICVYWDVFKKNIKIFCSDVVGVTNLCMWDDSIIGDNVSLDEAVVEKEPFLTQVFNAYPTESFYDGCKILKDHLLDLSIELVNGITFHIYCYEVWVDEN